MEIGLIGLGNMGRNLALNLCDKKYKLHVYNRTASKTDSIVEQQPNIVPHYSIKSLCEGIKSKEKIILLIVTAGKLIDDMLFELEGCLTSNDIVIDIGNSYFKDTTRRAKSTKFYFVGAGISGGELGARYGGSIMVGCDEKIWGKIKSILYDLSIESALLKHKCCKWFGTDGAGHFVKMVHNGIEYCDMNVIAEAYLLLKNANLSNEKISSVFDEWNNKRLKSYLLEISSKILIKKENEKFMVDEIEDSAQQKGTGKECCVEAVDLGVPAITMVSSTFSRLLTSQTEVRKCLQRKLIFETKSEILDGLIEKLEKAVYLCRAISYTQGLNLLAMARDKYKWNEDLTDVSDVWSNGCILRGEFLKIVAQMTKNQKQDFETSDVFVQIHNDNIDCLKEIVVFASQMGLPIPAISSCFNYINILRVQKSYGNLIQGMRDCFGGHSVIIKGNTKSGHIDWLND